MNHCASNIPLSDDMNQVSAAMASIPVMRPRLPAARALAPYLEKIDSRRIYSNFGPLARALEDRLSTRYGLPEGTVGTVANATLGLALALSAQHAQPGTLCVMPAWTFVASAHAAAMAGLTPYFVDVDSETWALDPEQVADAIALAPGPVGAVMPVAPFGRPIDISTWDRFRARTGLPVVIDAAAGFDALRPGEVPAVVSLHATKVLGTGEGGFVVSTDPTFKSEIRARSNFGFAGTREAMMIGANAKLSEYHAAVGLAALDEWDETRHEWMTLAQYYRTVLPSSNWIAYQKGNGTDWIASTCVVSFASSDLTRIESALDATGIESRRWWGQGAHAHTGTAQFPRTSLPRTSAIAQSALGLPFCLGLQSREMQKIAETVLAALGP
jgi:dTDP-4-amino-4,6-dideoxygalactose transaminase